MDVLTIILACSLHPDDQLVRALVAIQSRDNINFVGDLATLKTNDSLRSPAAALAFAEEIARQGGKPAVGLLGVPLAWAERYNLPPIALFDACTNIAVGTAALDSYRATCRPLIHPGAARRSRPRRRPVERDLRGCILAAFAKDLGLSGDAAAVLARLAQAGRGSSADDRVDQPVDMSPVVLEDRASYDISGDARSVFFFDRTPTAAPAR